MLKLMITVGLINWAVTFFLLLSSELLSQGIYEIWHKVLGAFLSAVHSSLCLFPQFSLLGNIWCRWLVLIVVSVVSFGARSFRKTIYFLLLEFSLTAFGTGAHGKIGEAVLGIAGFVCLFALSKRERTIPIELCWVDQRVKFTAMLDTGNRLKDPVTGQPVLVVGCDVAKELVALTKEQLQDPVQTITEGVFPGLRLIPYSTISQPNAMMLALRIPCAKVGNKKGSVVVAFAPEMIAGNGKYRGLMGGTV